ncbi:MATE family efflux transporter [Bacillus marinisedimentorum]|uniref:MATE family efflux transporter n=1 Tax=Bacillus marinisedimentorum TaxID=1821260 RepID=UPI0008724C28|nr:MATE family efflux transporter [Bacillus marinisedimentorum]
MTEKKKLTLFALTWPIFIEIFLHMLMGNADTLMLSQYSDNAVASVGVSNQILSVIIVMFGFVATGTAILVAQHLGAKSGEEAAEVSGAAITLNLIFGLLLSVILYVFSAPILKMMDLPGELMDSSRSYLQIVGGLAFIQALIMTISAIIRSYGYTRDTMYVTMGMNALNVIGNYLFIFGPFGIPVLGVTGVAISTAASRFLGLLVLAWLLHRRLSHNLSFAQFIRIKRGHVANLLKIGIPSAGEHLSYNGSQIAITYFVAAMGTEALTTKVYAQNIMMFIFLLAVAIGQGTQIMIGRLVGAGKTDEAYYRCIKSLKLAVIFSLGASAAASLFAEDLLHIFTDNDQIIQTGALLIYMTLLLEPGRAFNLVIINSLRAAGDVRFPVYIGILSMWGVSVTVSYLLGITLGLGLAGVWIAFSLDEWLRGILMLKRWNNRKWASMRFVRPV